MTNGGYRHPWEGIWPPRGAAPTPRFYRVVLRASAAAASAGPTPSEPMPLDQACIELISRSKCGFDVTLEEV